MYQNSNWVYWKAQHGGRLFGAKSRLRQRLLISRERVGEPTSPYHSGQEPEEQLAKYMLTLYHVGLFFTEINCSSRYM